jgi:Flp pilus assembly protein TadD
MWTPSPSRTPADSARAYQDWVVAYQQRDFGTSGASGAIFRSTRTDLLRALADTYIRLGRTADAIEAGRLAVRVAPFHEGAHYLLGNGYTARSYTDLFAAFPQAFADAAGRATLARVDTLLAAGNSDLAWKVCEDLAALHPGWADVRVRQGSVVFNFGSFDAALHHFAEALSVCPEYGRAHNGLAKAVGDASPGGVHRPA